MPSDMFSNRVSSLTNASQSFLKGMILVDLPAQFLITPAQQPSALGILLRRRGQVLSSRCRYRLSDYNRSISQLCSVQVWDGVSDARITFDASELGLPEPEHGIARLTENLNLQRALLRHLRRDGAIELLDKTKVSSIVRDTDEKGGWPLINLDNARTLRARLLVFVPFPTCMQ